MFLLNGNTWSHTVIIKEMIVILKVVSALSSEAVEYTDRTFAVWKGPLQRMSKALY